jgi:thioredoxin reductase
MAVREEKIVRLEGEEGGLQSLVFGAGLPVEFRSLFFNTAQYQRSGLAAKLGCEIKRNGGVRTDLRQRTCVPGLYLAGDADKEMQFVIVAAAEGAKAAMTINRELQDEERGR